MTHHSSLDWPTPLPDFSRPGQTRRLRIGGCEFTLQLTPVLRGVDGEADTDLVQLQVLYDGRPLAPADLGLGGPACLNVWSYLCNKLTEALVDFYDPKQRVAVGDPEATKLLRKPYRAPWQHPATA